MRPTGLIVIFLLLVILPVCGQTRYMLQFTDKGGSSFSLSQPERFLSERAIARKARHAVVIDSFDLPVSQKYIDSVIGLPGVTLLNVSRWLNAISIRISDEGSKALINSFSFVKANTDIAARFTGHNARTEPGEDQVVPQMQRLQSDQLDYGLSAAQINIHHGNFLHNLGLQGRQMRLAMLDGGFYNYVNVSALDSLLDQNRVIQTWDFVAGNDRVSDDAQHGLNCLSIISGNLPGRFIGSAPGAEMLLYRTEESATEYPIEEFNWVCAAERADSAGADLISSSLGYGYGFDDPAYDNAYADLDGRTSIAARGAVMAARKGLVVFNAAGNAGNDPWHYILTPADTDSLIAVAAVTKHSAVASFSSYGPSADGRIKPDIASVGAGTVLSYGNSVIGSSNGTSFACPNIAGLAACLWEGFPELNNMAVIEAVRKAGHQYNNPDSRIGYGIPDMRKAFLELIPQIAEASISNENCTIHIDWKSRDAKSMRYEIQRRLPGAAAFSLWKTVEVSGSDNLQEKEYSVTDTALANGQYSYRILQVVDTLTAEKLSGPIGNDLQVNVDQSCSSAEFPTIRILQNPVLTETLNVQVTTSNNSSSIQWQLYSSNGALLYSRSESKTGTTIVGEIPVQHLPHAMYLVRVLENGKLLGTRKIFR